MQRNKQSDPDYDSYATQNLRNEILRYLSFWPYLLILLSIFIFCSFIYLRYAETTYQVYTTVEIMDEAQDSEMALPTELTVFNRSMINLENEINRLMSIRLNSIVVSETKANILYFTKGKIKTSQTTKESWYEKYSLDFNIDTDLIDDKLVFKISTNNNKLQITSLDKDANIINSLKFSSLSTLDKNHNLPFNLTIHSDKNLSNSRELILNSVKNQANNFIKPLFVEPLGKDSDQLIIKLTHRNTDIALDYLNNLVKFFDEDGISDRQLEYERTIDFVNQREKIIKKELNIIELKKQNYKQENNISNVDVDASNNINLKFTYNSEIFELDSQKQIAQYLIELVSDSKYDYLPINIGLENFDLNNMINEYNQIISDRYTYENEAGSNNFLVKSLEPQLDNLIQNISFSLANFSNSIDLKLNNLKLKESEFDNEYNRVPENEKTLRSIERQLTIKEALYLLLLQKREEASINSAVVKPTIKVIDYSIKDINSKKPNTILIYFGSIILALVIYFLILYVWFFMDNKVHNKDQMLKILDNNIPIIAEIPFIDNIESIKTDLSSRSIISESIRILLSNLRFTSFRDSENKKCQTIIFTSSIKGEGKTIVSVNTALNLASDISMGKRVLLLGTDLRNPQVHKSFGVDRSKKGISELIYNKDFKNYKNYINKFENLDVLFSGSIPPNPTAILSSDIFKNFVTMLKNDYDYIIIDTAPCMLVADTLQYIDLADSIVYIFRTNFTDSKIVEFINEIYNDKQIKNLNIVLNAVGNSASYGYKYGYQYGYKYKYNYGYGYTYDFEDD